MGKTTIDLHMHSCYSDDGEFTPTQLVEQCREAGIGMMAVSDHNIARANREGREAARKAGILYVSAIEIDCSFQNVNFHVLGYGIADGSPDFLEVEENIRRQSREASFQMLEATRKLGFDIREEELRQLEAGKYWQDHWTGEMFGEVLLNRPDYADHPLLAPYRPGGSRSENPYVSFYWDFYSQGKCCYAPMKYPEMKRTVEMIHANGGKAVLAHPGMNLKGRRELLEPVLNTGMDGIEAYSSYHTAEQAEDFHRAAERYGLFATCGSDYHGRLKPGISLGGHGSRLSAAEEKALWAMFSGRYKEESL